MSATKRDIMIYQSTLKTIYAVAVVSMTFATAVAKELDLLCEGEQNSTTYTTELSTKKSDPVKENKSHKAVALRMSSDRTMVTELEVSIVLKCRMRDDNVWCTYENKEADQCRKNDYSYSLIITKIAGNMNSSGSFTCTTENLWTHTIWFFTGICKEVSAIKPLF